MPTFLPYTQSQLEIALQHLKAAIYTPIARLTIDAWCSVEPLPYNQRTQGDALLLQVGDKWGDLFDCAWFHFTGKVPPKAAGQQVVLLLDVNGEMLVVDAAGEPVRGLTTVVSEYDYSLGEPGKRVLPLFNPAQGGEVVDVWAEAGANDLFGNLKGNGTIKEAAIAICYEPLQRLFYDFEVLLDASKVLPPDSARLAQLLQALNDAVHALWGGTTPEAVTQATALLTPVLSQRGGDPALSLSAIGHAHMDLGWLWPIRETKRKGARTFATALANFAQYPAYRFAASQAQLFQWMKEGYPNLYARICQAVKAGQIEPQGALWVECDTHLTAGESIVRQMLYGRRFFRQEFGIDPRFVWLPDAFGYSGALPGIMQAAGVDVFSTQKLSWSLINHFPHQSFRWQGINGAQVLVHMLPEETYNSPALPRSLARAENNYQDKGVSSHALLAFGIGDGGGGPGEEHLERLERLGNFAGLAPVKQEWSVEFFDKWRTEAERFPVWVGELYLERHQGTLTTNARNKWFNRRIEQALRQLEYTAALASRVAGFEYPRTQLESIWKEVLLYQFHDILPGSSIKRVYDESLARYASLMDEVEGLTKQAEAALVTKIDTSAAQQPVVAINSLSWTRNEWLNLEGQWRQTSVPPHGCQVIDLAATPDPILAPEAAADRLENQLVRVSFDESGAIKSLVVKATGHELVPPGELANRLVVFADHGDAWDFAMDYAVAKPTPLTLVDSRAWVDGPYAIIEQTYKLGYSKLVQQVRLAAHSRQVEFCSRLHWRETATMLRALFPVNLLADEASFDIQFGHIRRPTHTNTTWDLARDEVPAQKWVDLSQRDYGLALLNDSKYGHRAKGHTLELDLLRSVPYPGPRLVRDDEVAPGEAHHAYTDQGEHEFRYALFLHSGDAVEGGVVKAAYEFNIPLRMVKTDAHPSDLRMWGGFLTTGHAGVVIESVKLAEDSQSLVVRLYEAARSHAIGRLRIGFQVKSAQAVDLMEENPHELTVDEWGGIRLEYQPFEIKTILLT